MLEGFPNMELKLKTPNTFLSNEPIGRDDIPEHSPIRKLDLWWREKRLATGFLPKRKDIDPIELGQALIPWLFTLEVLRDGPALDFRFRLVGTANVRLVGRDATGMLASDIFRDGDRMMIKSSFDQTVEMGEPTYWRAKIPHEQDFPVSVYRALYPLADNGGFVDNLVCTAIPESVQLPV